MIAHSPIVPHTTGYDTSFRSEMGEFSPPRAKALLDMFGYVDKDEVYQYANKGYSDWYGHPEGAVTGRAVPDVIGDHVYGQVRESVRKALSGQQITYEYHMQRDGKDVFARSTLVHW